MRSSLQQGDEPLQHRRCDRTGGSPPCPSGPRAVFPVDCDSPSVPEAWRGPARDLRVSSAGWGPTDCRWSRTTGSRNHKLVERTAGPSHRGSCTVDPGRVLASLISRTSYSSKASGCPIRHSGSWRRRHGFLHCRSNRVPSMARPPLAILLAPGRISGTRLSHATTRLSAVGRLPRFCVRSRHGPLA